MKLTINLFFHNAYVVPYSCFTVEHNPVEFYRSCWVDSKAAQFPISRPCGFLSKHILLYDKKYLHLWSFQTLKARFKSMKVSLEFQTFNGRHYDFDWLRCVDEVNNYWISNRIKQTQYKSPNSRVQSKSYKNIISVFHCSYRKWKSNMS